MPILSCNEMLSRHFQLMLSFSLIRVSCGRDVLFRCSTASESSERVATSFLKHSTYNPKSNKVRVADKSEPEYQVSFCTLIRLGSCFEVRRFVSSVLLDIRDSSETWPECDRLAPPWWAKPSFAATSYNRLWLSLQRSTMTLYHTFVDTISILETNLSLQRAVQRWLHQRSDLLQCSINRITHLLNHPGYHHTLERIYHARQKVKIKHMWSIKASGSRFGI
jgi:hypothetical protein